MRKGKQRYKVIPFTTFFEEFARENFDDGGGSAMLINQVELVEKGLVEYYVENSK